MLPSLQVCTYVATWYIPMCKYFSLIHYQHIHTGMYICSRKTSVQCVLMSHFLGEVESKIDLFIFFSEFCVRSHHFVLPTSFSIFPFHLSQSCKRKSEEPTSLSPPSQPQWTHPLLLSPCAWSNSTLPQRQSLCRTAPPTTARFPRPHRGRTKHYS